MAKKKRRYCKKKSKKTLNLQENRHHLLWTRRKWNKGPQKKLRRHPYCVITIPTAGLHQKIHRKVDYVPLPNPACIDSAIFQLNILYNFGGISDNDPIEKRLRVLIAIFDCSSQETADALRKQLQVVYDYERPSK